MSNTSKNTNQVFRFHFAFFPFKGCPLCASQFYSGTLETPTFKIQKIHTKEHMKNLKNICKM